MSGLAWQFFRSRSLAELVNLPWSAFRKAEGGSAPSLIRFFHTEAPQCVGSRTVHGGSNIIFSKTLLLWICGITRVIE